MYALMVLGNIWPVDQIFLHWLDAQKKKLKIETCCDKVDKRNYFLFEPKEDLRTNECMEQRRYGQWWSNPSKFNLELDSEIVQLFIFKSIICCFLDDIIRSTMGSGFPCNHWNSSETLPKQDLPPQFASIFLFRQIGSSPWSRVFISWRIFAQSFLGPSSVSNVAFIFGIWRNSTCTIWNNRITGHLVIYRK